MAEIGGDRPGLKCFGTFTSIPHYLFADIHKTNETHI
jgi:hypothetical protein